MNGKIACLPKPIREQLNRRLDNGELRKTLLAWLNSLPEVQSILAAHFGGQPLSKQNLHEWVQNGFRTWKLRQDALDFASSFEPDPEPEADPGPQESNAPGSQSSSEPDAPADAPATGSTSDLTDKLVHWLALRFAATARHLTSDHKNPDADLRRLRQLTGDIVALRRGDLYSRRVAIEEQRLALLVGDSQEQREAEFWEWTERPDIRAKLVAEHLKDKVWNATISKMIPELAPYFNPPTPAPGSQSDENIDPAILI